MGAQSERSRELPRRGAFPVVSRSDGGGLRGLRGGECSGVSPRSLGGRRESREEDALAGPRSQPSGNVVTRGRERARPGGAEPAVDSACTHDLASAGPGVETALPRNALPQEGWVCGFALRS